MKDVQDVHPKNKMEGHTLPDFKSYYSTNACHKSVV